MVKLSTHARAVAGVVVIAFLSTLFNQPEVMDWVHTHHFAQAFVASASVAFHAYNTYASPTEESE